VVLSRSHPAAGQAFTRVDDGGAHLYVPAASMRLRASRIVAVVGGAGAMGRAVVHDLARDRVAVRLIETDGARARAVARRYGRGRAAVVEIGGGDVTTLARGADGARVLVNCGPYGLNLAAMRAALAAGCHYVDLGGLFHTTRRQLELDGEFRRARLLAVLGMGSAPGTTNMLAAAAARPLTRVESIHVYNGGADFTPGRPALSFGFSPATLLDELSQRPMVFTRGRFASRPPLSGGEDFDFDLGRQRVHLSLHSEVATLPLSLASKGIRECTFKIAYEPALVERLRGLIELGLADPRPGPRGVAPRDVLLDALRRLPPGPEVVDDRDALAVVVTGRDRRGPLVVRYELTAGPQRRPPLSAVARNTGFPPAIVARMLIDGRIRARGVYPPETCVPVAPFLRALAARGLAARRTLSR
jgi:saccharopine dehydrogenase-like NADP-dependent oxidoreductase